MLLTELAPAKVNLFLHVGRPAADGYHDVNSLMVFADAGDEVTLELGGSGFGVRGPFASELAEGDNLVTRARDLFLESFGGTARPIGLTLKKNLPIAAGLGGGSADAAATLRVLSEAWELPADARLQSSTLGQIARVLGADVAACLASDPVIAQGRGDILSPAPALPVLSAVLVNPLAPSSTAAVYQALDDDEAWATLAAPAPTRLRDVGDVVAWLGETRNDLQSPAVRLLPEIGDVLTALGRENDCLLARMSGSGATCFALCADEERAASLAARIAARRPGWWVKTCLLASACA